MKTPPLPPDEAGRLRELRSYSILDTEAETPYDETTSLAALICEAPFSLITLVDEDRQWFKSRHGWEQPESSRAISFCAHAIHEPDLMVVSDAAEDERFRENPFVTDAPGIRFYAGAPLVTPGGHAVGTLCVIDRVPRTLTPDQEQALRVLRTHVMTLMELRRSSRRLDLTEELVSSLPGVFYLFNREGRYLRWNRRLEKLTGYSPEEMRELHPLDLFRGQDRDHIEERIRKAFETGSAEAEAGLVTRDGTVRPHYFTGRLMEFDGEPCLIGVGIDVTRQKEAEAERERLFNLSPDPLCVVGLDGLFREVNPAWTKVLGHSRDELLGQRFMDFVHPDDQDATRAEFERNQEGDDTWTFENRYRHRDGGWRWLSWHSSVDRERGVVYGVARDVTEERAVAEALRKSEERYRTLVESARDAILTLTQDGAVASVNRAFEAITGWAGEEWLGRPYEELLHPDDLALGREMFGKLGREESMPVFEVRVVGRGGKHIPVEIKATAFQSEEGELRALLVARDVRTRKALDERLRRLQRLDAVGRLAAGVAHDFNNVLTVIRVEADLLMAEPEAGGDLEEGLRQIRSAAEQGVGLTGRLMTLGRDRQLQFQELDLNEVIRKFSPMMDRLMGHGRVFKTALCQEPTPIRCDPGMLEQVLMNLVINASDAMSDGGRVTLATERVVVNEETAARFPEARPGSCIHLSVADTGTGISPEHLAQIFEPLFTTKEEGQGTGLGLATAYSVVQQHGGWMDVESEPGEGSTFHVYLPAAD